MNNKLLHKTIRVTGKVQGVAFRKYTYEAAKTFKLCGFVKNLDDGSVYIEAEGKKEDIENFITWCHKGSPFSQVEDVIAKDEPIKYFANFEIL